MHKAASHLSCLPNLYLIAALGVQLPKLARDTLGIHAMGHNVQIQ